MTGRRSGFIVGGIALLAMLIGMPVGAAAGGKIIATLNGRHARWRGRLVNFQQTGTGFIATATKNFGRKTIGFGCPILLTGQTFPVTMTVCNALYMKRMGARSIGWTNTNDVTVTFTSFNGTVVEGSFSGTLPAVPFQGDGTTLTLAGTFKGPVQQ